MKNRKSFAENTIILFISMIISKAVGALFKIPLTNIIGGVGMGYYSTAYSLFTPIFAVTAAGIPTVIVKVIANNIAASNYSNAKKVLWTALFTFGTAGFAGTLLIILLAVPFADYAAQSPESAWAIFAIAPSVFICCISSVLKGYYEGLCNMAPTAVSQVVEAVSRAVFGLGLAYLILNYGVDCYNAGEPVFGAAAETLDRAVDATLPFAAAGAIAAVTISELCGMLVLAVRHRLCKDCFEQEKSIGEVQRFSEIAKVLIKDCIPISLGAVVINLSSFIDLMTISRCINFSITENPVYFTNTFGTMIKSQGGSLRLANFMYGSYTGLCGTMFMLIPSFTGMLGRSALPEIAAAWSVNNRQLFKRKLSVVLKSNFIIGFPLYLGMAGLSGEILSVLYAGRPDEISVSVLPLFIQCIGGVFLTLSSTFFSVFQVIGRSELPIKLMLAGSAVKLIFNVFLITIPQFNISGAAISTVVSYAVVALGGYLALEAVTGSDYKILSLMFAPLAAGIFCGATAKFSYDALSGYFKAPVVLLIAIVIGALFYVLLLIILGGVHPKDLLNRQKIKK